MRDMELISGIGDFCQVYVTYKTQPRCSLIIFTFKVVNMTNFQLANLALSFQSSQNLEVRPNQSAAQTTIGSSGDANGSMDGFGGGGGALSSGLSQHESFEWSVTTRLLSLEEIPSIALRIDIRATESCPEDLLSYQITTVPFQASLFDLLIPDQSVFS